MEVSELCEAECLRFHIAASLPKWQIFCYMIRLNELRGFDGTVIVKASVMCNGGCLIPLQKHSAEQ